MSAIYNIHMFKTTGDIKNLVGRGNWKGRNFNVNKLIKKSKETDYYFIIGTEEGGAIEENIKLKLIMDREKINHYFQIYPGNHTNNFWRMHIQEMMEYAVARLVKDRQ
jgi:enterochelin esterase-like enzyme